jgi:hypothetical protein
MDLPKIIRELSEDKARLEAVIAMLEELQRNSVKIPDFSLPKKKGRGPMPPEERQDVSARMKRYWARYRQERELSHSA